MALNAEFTRVIMITFTFLDDDDEDGGEGESVEGEGNQAAKVKQEPVSPEPSTSRGSLQEAPAAPTGGISTSVAGKRLLCRGSQRE